MVKTHPQHTNQVRIIGGVHRGRKISFPSADGLRPTADSVRERLFNWLGQDLTGMSVLDLFAGSGVLGLEAASRHAEQVIMVEMNRLVAAAIKDNQTKLQLGQINIVCTDAFNFLAKNKKQFQIIFVDPPYAWKQWDLLLRELVKHMLPQARVYLESDALPTLPAGWTILKHGKSGKSRFALLVYEPEV